MANRYYGLGWKRDIWGSRIPRWTEEPNEDEIKTIAKRELRLESPIKVKFFASGSFNKLYSISSGQSEYIFRVPLPIDPGLKTRSEVETIKVVHELTSFPLPGIMASCPSNDNDLKFEWFIMDRLPGKCLYATWNKLDMDQKESFVKQMAKFHAILFETRWNAIGSLGTVNDQKSPGLGNPNYANDNGKHPLGPSVQMAFCFTNTLNLNVPRGPFFSDYDWLHAWITAELLEGSHNMRFPDDEDVEKCGAKCAQLASKLLKILPLIFPPDEPTTTCLVHNDLSERNILTDNSGNVTGIVDWEATFTMPLWLACQFPKFLVGRVRHDKPDKDEYGSDSDSEDESNTKDDQHAVDKQGKTTLYWEALQEWEQGQLRKVFLEEMKHLAPEWYEQHIKSRIKMILIEIIGSGNLCDDRKAKMEWINAIEAGEKPEWEHQTIIMESADDVESEQPIEEVKHMWSSTDEEDSDATSLEDSDHFHGKE